MGREGKGKHGRDVQGEIEHMSERLVETRGNDSAWGFKALVIIAEEALDQTLQSALGT